MDFKKFWEIKKLVVIYKLAFDFGEMEITAYWHDIDNSSPKNENIGV